MRELNALQLSLFIVVFLGCIPLLGRYIQAIMLGPSTFSLPVLHQLEKLSYRLCGINPSEQMNWKQYLVTLLWLHLLGFLAIFIILTTQALWPLNPELFASLSWPLATNIAISFVTNTGWQMYAPETTISYFSQLCGLGVQNFLSGASGMAVFFALTRAICRQATHLLGNFWVDLVRTIVYLLLPLSLFLAIALVSQGVIQTFTPYVTIKTVEGQQQTIPMGPVAAQVAIQQLGGNGGGFFYTSSAHPFENPTALSNFLQSLAMVLIPASCVYAFGLAIGKKKQAITLLSVKAILWGIALAIALWSEYQGNPKLAVSEVLEGKETRYGIMSSVLWLVNSTASGHGSVNAMLDSCSALTGAVALVNILCNAVILGSLGIGMCKMLFFILITIFLCGLLVGRSAEYFGKKIELYDVHWGLIAIFAPGLFFLLSAALAANTSLFYDMQVNHGPHGLTELAYSFASCVQNNGSSFMGINATSPLYQLTMAAVMLFGRLASIIPALALAGSYAKKIRTLVPCKGIETDSWLFGVFLLAVVVLYALLIALPLLLLGPIMENLLA